MEQRCFNQRGVGIYTVLQGGYSQQRQRLKFQTYKTEDDPYQRELQTNNHLLPWLIKRKRVLITVMRNAWIPQPLERRASPLNS